MLLPLLPHHDVSDPVAWYQGALITAGQFETDVVRLAQRLPARGAVLNVCENRYHFLVAFFAALVRGQLNLLPPNRTPRTLAQLQARYPALYCIADGVDAPEGIDMLRYDRADVLSATSAGAARLVLTADAVAALVFTSGSTGEPQPHAKTWGSLLAVAESTVVRFGLRRDERTHFLATVPAQHMYGLETSIVLPLRVGGVVHSARPFFARDIEQALAELEAPRVLVTTPVHLRACTAERVTPPALRFVLSATAPLSAAQAEQTESCFGAPVMEIYGCTEAGTVATRRTIDGERWQLLDGVSARMNGAECAIEGNHLPAPVILNDTIRLVGDTELVLLGRKADLINIGGKRMSLADLNLKLLEVPGVQDGTFVMPDEAHDRVVRLTALVVANGRSRDEIMAELRKRVDPVFLPRPLYLVTQLPRNTTGKLVLDQLRELMARCAAASAIT